MFIEGSQPFGHDLDRSLVGVGLPGGGSGVERIPGSIRVECLWEPQERAGETVPPVVLRNSRRSSAMSRAVVYRSDARFDHCLQADAFQFLGDRVVDLARRAGFRRGDQVHHFVASFVFVSALAMNGLSPGQQFVEDHAQAEDVGSPIDPVPFATGLLRTHVGGCPSDPATLAEVLVLERKTEIGNERLSRSIDQDVGGLDVPVDQALGCERNAGLRRPSPPIPPTRESQGVLP